MIIETIINAIVRVLYTLFDLFPDIPNIPNINAQIEEYFRITLGNTELLGVFIDIDTMKFIIPIFLVVYNFDHIYKFIMFIVKKLPFSID